MKLSFVLGAPQQYSGYNQQQQQPLNGGSPGGGGYHPPPSYNRPLSAPGGGGYMNPVSSAQGYSGKGLFFSLHLPLNNPYFIPWSL